jgi:hypothetical protein
MSGRGLTAVRLQAYSSINGDGRRTERRRSVMKARRTIGRDHEQARELGAVRVVTIPNYGRERGAWYWSVDVMVEGGLRVSSGAMRGTERDVRAAVASAAAR